MIIRSSVPSDREQWLDLRVALWPRHDRAAHRAEIEVLIDRPQTLGLTRFDVLVCIVDESNIVGFLEMSTRPQVDICGSGSAGYVEGIYVAPACRRHGAGRALVSAAAALAIATGCRQLASDGKAENALGIAFHRGVGFAVAGYRGGEVLFCKPLDGNA